MQIEKCRILIEGLRRNIEEVAALGISAAQLDVMEQNLSRLTEAGRECDALRAKLSEKVKNMNGILVDVKDSFIETKKKIKGSYQQYDWSKYGVMDKR